MPTETQYQYCPECRGEYTLSVTVCVDCDVALVSGDALAAEAQALEDFPPAAELAIVRVAPLAWIRALSEALQQTGVAHRVEPATASDAPEDQRPDVFGDVQLFGLYVEHDQLSSAGEIDGSMAAQLLPEQAPALDEGEDDACPACGATLPAAATECADCGLSFG